MGEKGSHLRGFYLGAGGRPQKNRAIEIRKHA